MHVLHGIFAILAIIAAGSGIAQAHVDALTGQDYQGFERNDGKGSCCDWHDCRPSSAPFAGPNGEEIMDRGGNTFAFDPGKVVRRPSDDGNWHICANSVRLNCIIAPNEAERWPKASVPRFSRLDAEPLAVPLTGVSAIAPICFMQAP
jgi:hypothetical protein